MNKQNDDKRMQEIMQDFAPGTPLLLQVCCAPCASCAIERLGAHFALTLLYYNPNIQPKAEYDKRFAAFAPLLQSPPTLYPLRLEQGPYDSEHFLALTEPLASEAEGGRRCELCFSMRLDYTASQAKQRGFPCFASSLSVGPRKNAAQINHAGDAAAWKFGSRYLPSDLKKQNGYQRSIFLSRELGLYRQSYCGCPYSRTPKEDK